MRQTSSLRSKELNWSEKECLRLLYERGVMRPGELATELKLSHSTITELLQRLAEKGFIVYEKYKEARLSKDGTLMAMKIVRKHRLLEVLFVKMGLNACEACLEARKVDYLISDDLAYKMCYYLGNPEKCPCGKRIP